MLLPEAVLAAQDQIRLEEPTIEAAITAQEETIHQEEAIALAEVILRQEITLAEEATLHQEATLAEVILHQEVVLAEVTLHQEALLLPEETSHISCIGIENSSLEQLYTTQIRVGRGWNGIIPPSFFIFGTKKRRRIERRDAETQRTLCTLRSTLKFVGNFCPDLLAQRAFYLGLCQKQKPPLSFPSASLRLCVQFLI